MDRKTKIWLTVAASLVLVGAIIFGGAMTVLKWDFTKLSTYKYETNEHTLQEKFQNIRIVTNTADIVLAATEKESASIVCYEQENVKHSVAVEDGTLVIEVADSRKWYEHIGINFGRPKITVYLPQGQYTSLSINSNTGDVEIPREFAFESIDISANTGDVINYASSSLFAKIQTSTGHIRVANTNSGMLDLSVTTGNVAVSNVNCSGDVRIQVSTGDANLSDIRCNSLISCGNTGDITMKNVIAGEKFTIERTTGDVKFDGCDADEIFVCADTGNVTGSLLSGKDFVAETDTGRVEVPNTTGGRCEIRTNTGNIRISV